jgi:hypothetical protein
MACNGSDWGETAFPAENGERGRAEAVGDPSLNASPEDLHVSELPAGGDVEIGPVKKDGGDEGNSQPVAQVGGEAGTWGESLLMVA